jgi:multidrug efflux pump subunit AcrA (membrane-fusion protein)
MTLHTFETRAPALIASAALWTICAAVVAAVVIASQISINLVVGGEGVVVPGGESARVQSQRDGRVAEILVAEGTLVARGAPIVRLATPELDARVKELTTRLEVQRNLLDAQRRLQSLNERGRELARVKYTTDARATSAALAAALGDARGSAAEAERRNARLGSQQALVGAGVMAVTQFEEAFYQQLQAAERARQSNVRAGSLRIDLEKLRQTRDGEELDAQRFALTSTIEIEETLDLVAALERELAVAKVQRDEATIPAPRDGYVEELAVRHPGEVVAPGETLALLVPRQEEFVLEVRVPSRSVGLVHPGQVVRVKLDSYPYREYGLASGRVLRVPTDVARKQSERSGFYMVLIQLTERPKDASGKPVVVRAGMTGIAEMLVRRERLLRVVLRAWSGGWDALEVR